MDAHNETIFGIRVLLGAVTGLSELERHLLVPYSTKANAIVCDNVNWEERKLGRMNHVAHRRHLLLLNMVQGEAFLVLIDL